MNCKCKGDTEKLLVHCTVPAVDPNPRVHPMYTQGTFMLNLRSTQGKPGQCTMFEDSRLGTFYSNKWWIKASKIHRQVYLFLHTYMEVCKEVHWVFFISLSLFVSRVRMWETGWPKSRLMPDDPGRICSLQLPLCYMSSLGAFDLYHSVLGPDKFSFCIQNLPFCRWYWARKGLQTKTLHQISHYDRHF